MTRGSSLGKDQSSIALFENSDWKINKLSNFDIGVGMYMYIWAQNWTSERTLVQMMRTPASSVMLKIMKQKCDKMVLKHEKWTPLSSVVYSKS